MLIVLLSKIFEVTLHWNICRFCFPLGGIIPLVQVIEMYNKICKNTVCPPNKEE